MRLNSLKLIRFILVFPLLVSLGACVSSDMSDLSSWVSDVLQRPGGRIDPIPEIKPYVAYSYLSGEKGRRDPFQSFYQEAVDEVELDANAGLTPEMERELRNRNREELEQYELDSLRMVGIMKNEESDWGIIMDPNGTVHRVRVGNYLGRNVGKIVNIFENRIEMREIFQNTQGRWEEREASVALNEVE